MPIIYVPKFMSDLDYKLLTIMDNMNGKVKFDTYFLDKYNLSYVRTHNAFMRLNREGLVLFKCRDSVIVEVELTYKAQSFLAEHILGV
jgi:hypothetical protein